MKIELITMWYNEEFLAPFFLNHYSWVDKIHILLTPSPNDRTEAIAKRYPNVEIEYFRFPDDKIDDVLKVNKFNEKYRSLTEADYVILVDSDEFIFCDQIDKPVRSHLEATMKDVYFVNFWQVYKNEHDSPLDPKQPAVYQRRHGDPNMSTPFNILYVKPVVLRGKLDIRWTPGNHELMYRGKSLFWRTRNTDELSAMNVSTTKAEMLQGAHWRLVDLQETITRRIGFRKNRISQNNLSKGLGFQNFTITEEDILKEYNDHNNDPEVIKDGGIPDWPPVKEILQEANNHTPGDLSPAVNRNNPLRQNKQASYYGFARPEVIDAIKKNALPTGKVLEIGCAGGATAKNLKENLPVQSYVGIDVSKEAADIAKNYLDRVIVADIEKTDLASEYGLEPAEFDLLLALDVLEHLYNPWDVLSELSRYLKPGGYVVASVPNIQNITVVQDLIQGNWQYRDAGILDATHLRFFTFEASKQMFTGAGLAIKNIELVINPPLNMDEVKESGNVYRRGNLELTNLTRNELLRLFTYQYIIVAQKPVSPAILNATAQARTPSGKDGQTAREHSGQGVDSLTSIIILTFNQLEYTKKCVKSIEKATSEPHEIIFVDNGSTDGTVKWLKTRVRENKNYNLIENKQNLGFAKGCNQGIEASRGQFVCLLNNDVVLSHGWLAGLLACLKHAPAAGIVGPMTNNISGPQQVSSNEYRSVNDLNKYAAKFRERFNHRRIPTRRIVGFCMLFKRELVDKIGLLDESFGTGNFEDDDFCLRAVLGGYDNYIAGDVYIHHYGSRSFIGNGIDYSSSILGNKQIFDAKWTGIRLDTPLGKKLAAHNAITKADELNQKGRHDQAIAALVEGLKQVPQERTLYYRIAELMLDTEFYKEALKALDNPIVAAAGKDLRCLEILACAKAGMGEDGEEYVGRMLEADNACAPALNLKALNIYKQGNQEAAESLLSQAIAADPGYGKPYTNLGILRWASGRKDEALDYLEKGFILSPTLTDCLSMYHSAITELRQFARAEDIVRDAKTLHPSSRNIAFLFIDILIKQDKYASAMEEVEKAMVEFDIDDGMLAAALQIRAKVGIKEVGTARNNNKGTLSLCMIVKDEERHLARCLLSAKPVVDEMIIVDTGSTDKTKSIAIAYGARVFDFPWTNDFSAARNQSLAKASGDWILVLDADEVISPLDYAAFEQIVKKKPARPVAYSMATRNYTYEVAAEGWTANDHRYGKEEAGTGWFPSHKVRLFINDKRIQFQNPVHEFVEESLQKAGMEIKTLNIPVHHYGRFDKDRLTAKGRKYFLLGIQKIEQMKGDVKALKELAVQASELGEYETGVELWKKVIELDQTSAAPFLNMSYAYLKMEKYQEALLSSRRALELEPALKEAALNYAGSELIAGDITKTISVLETLLQTNPDYPPAMALIAAAYYIDGQKETGLVFFERLRKKGFNCTEFINEQYRGVISQGKLDQAISLLEAAVKTGNIDQNTHRLLAECRNKLDSHQGREAAPISPEQLAVPA